MENSEEYSFTINLFGKVFYEGNFSELRKQKAIWKVFGVDYEAEKQKQQEIWDTFKIKAPRSAFKHRLMLKQYLKVLIPPSKRREYEEFRRAVYWHLRHRPDFARRVDVKLIDRLARIWALWLLIEEKLSLGPDDQISKLTDAFYKIDAMLSKALEELEITPKMRKKIAEDLKEDDKITEQLKRLIGAK